MSISLEVLHKTERLSLDLLVQAAGLAVRDSQ